MATSFRIFVSCVNDSLAGRWVNPILECEDLDAFKALCENIVAEYGSEEYMFPDFDYGVEGICSEYMGCALAWQLATALEAADFDGNGDAFRAYCSLLSPSSIEEDMDYDSFLDTYMGEFDSGAEYAEQVAFDCGELQNVPDYIKYHIDWEAVWNNELRFDYNEVDSDHGTVYLFNS